MTDLRFDDPCLLFALGWENRPFLRTFPPQQRFPGAPCRARFCGPEWLSVLVLETGMGTLRMAEAVKWLLDKPALGDVSYIPKVVISAGFSGALQEDIKPGDLVLATEIVDTAGGRWSVPWPGDLSPGEWRPPLRRGRLVTVPSLITSPSEKRTLGEMYNALAVDMETATIARLCSEKGLPFGCLRAISDDLVTPLSPRLLSFFSNGRLSLPRLLLNFAVSPRLVTEAWRLGKQSHLAAQNLGLALGELLTLTLPWAKDF